MKMCSLRWITENLDYKRIPLNAVEREACKGDIPYWGANKIMDYVNRALLDERVILIGEDGAPFFDPYRDVAFLSEGPIWPNNHIHILRTDPRSVDDAYLVYSLNTVDYSLYINGATRDKLTQFQLGSIKIPLPELAMQRAIASYLDRETRRIDDLIAEKNSFITLLREKRMAAISHAVTKGIDKSVPMKPSGQDWLGDVPVHWDAVPANWLFHPSKKLALPDDQLLSATQKYGVIPLAEFEKLEGRKVTLAVTNLDKRKHVEVGDFVISMRSMDGGLERARARGSVRSSYIVLKFTDEVDGRFYGYLFKSKLFIQALRLTANFIRDGQDMHFGHFRAVKLPRLPLAEQEAIANHLDRETTRIDSIISETERSIALLKEKRTALITAAVTGKIDVRSAA